MEYSVYLYSNRRLRFKRGWRGYAKAITGVTVVICVVLWYFVGYPWSTPRRDLRRDYEGVTGVFCVVL